MPENKKVNPAKVAAGLVGVAAVAGAIGVVAKLLSNPKNRKKLGDKLSEVKKLATRSVKKAEKQIEKVVEDVTEKVTDKKE